MSAIKFHLSTSQDKDLDYEDSRRKEDTSEEEEGNNRFLIFLKWLRQLFGTYSYLFNSIPLGVG